MTNINEICTVCLQPGNNFHHIHDTAMTVIVEQLGFKAEDNFCDQCYSLIYKRKEYFSRQESLGQSGSVATMDVSSLPTTQSSQRDPAPRLSEMPLPISPRGLSSSGSSSNTPLDDTVDRMIGKKRRISKGRIDVIATQSLSLDDVNTSSQDLTRVPRNPVAQKQPKGSPKKNAHTSAQHQSDDSSLEELQIPPMPKKRRVRPGPKQFATGTLQFPSYIHTKVVSSDLPRVAAG